MVKIIQGVAFGLPFLLKNEGNSIDSGRLKIGSRSKWHATSPGIRYSPTTKRATLDPKGKWTLCCFRPKLQKGIASGPIRRLVPRSMNASGSGTIFNSSRQIKSLSLFSILILLFSNLLFLPFSILHSLYSPVFLFSQSLILQIPRAWNPTKTKNLNCPLIKPSGITGTIYGRFLLRKEKLFLPYTPSGIKLVSGFLLFHRLDRPN